MCPRSFLANSSREQRVWEQGSNPFALRVVRVVPVTTIPLTVIVLIPVVVFIIFLMVIVLMIPLTVIVLMIFLMTWCVG